MASKRSLDHRHRTQLRIRLLAVASALLLPFTLPAGGVVTAPTEANLRSAMAGGGTVTFACDGTIAVSNTLSINTDTVLDGSGHQISISGNNSVRVLYVSSNVNLTLSGLTIANGRSENGAGIFNAGGELFLQNCTLRNNSAIGTNGAVAYGGPGSNAYGGGVYNLGAISSINCAYISNSVLGGAGGWASIGAGGAGGSGNGGAFGNFGSFIATGCVLRNNRAAGGTGGQGGASAQGGAGGDGTGAAIANFGTLTLCSCLFKDNSSTGGEGGAGGSGNYNPGFSGTPGGAGGTGGSGNGGALFNDGAAFLVNDTLALNSGTGGPGGAGGQGGPPWNQSTASGNGGNGGSGGSGYGAAYDNTGQCYLTNSTLAFNQAIAGTGGVGGLPGPWPYPYPSHQGSPGANGADGPSGSALITTGAYFVNTLLASNSPANCTGAISDAGHNLSSDASPGFIGTGSLTNLDARIGPLANNGGTTLTIALLPGSPAIDDGDTSVAPVTDQRGFPRPAGSAADIGAFEYGSMLPVLSIVRSGPGLLDILVHGNSNQWCRLLTCTNFSDWTAVATNQISGDGTTLFHENCLPGAACWFYRVVMP